MDFALVPSVHYYIHCAIGFRFGNCRRINKISITKSVRSLCNILLSVSHEKVTVIIIN